MREAGINKKRSGGYGVRVGVDVAGFTLLEVLMAIVVISIALVGLASLLTTNIKGSEFGRNNTIATNLAREKMEEYIRQAVTDFSAINDSISGSDPVTGTNPDLSEDYGAISDFSRFSREVYITDTSSNKDVAVRVIWKDSSGVVHPVVLRTILSK